MRVVCKLINFVFYIMYYISVSIYDVFTLQCFMMRDMCLLSYLQWRKREENVSFLQLTLYIGVQVMYLLVYVGVYVQVCM